MPHVRWGGGVAGCIPATPAVIAVAVLSLVFLARKPARAARMMGASTPRPHSGLAGPRSFRAGLLDIAIPRDDPRGGGFARVMSNDVCVYEAVKRVTGTLVVTLRDTDGVPAGRVREYVGEIYSRLWDAACLENRPEMDCQVVLPREACGQGGSPLQYRPGWPKREQAEMAPDLQALFSDASRDLVELNRLREAAGRHSLELVSLEGAAAGAYNPEYFYLEDARAVVPSFKHVVCGGSFGPLHNGHKKLLSMAASLSEESLTVGVTSDFMLSHKPLRHLSGDLPSRIQAVREFLRLVNPELRTRVEAITDPFGPPAVEPGFDAIVCSSETIRGAEKINELRAGRGFNPLKVVVTRRTDASSLSSTSIRKAVKASGRPLEA